MQDNLSDRLKKVTKNKEDYEDMLTVWSSRFEKAPAVTKRLEKKYVSFPCFKHLISKESHERLKDKGRERGPYASQWHTEAKADNIIGNVKL